jgi:hypothetical protein
MAGAHQLDNSLEALTNLPYLVRRSLDDPARAEAYLDVADVRFLRKVFSGQRFAGALFASLDS